jgi:hypothetical protein
MISLVQLLQETFIFEGGKVFKDTEYYTANIDQGNIVMTVQKFTEALGELFKNKKGSFAVLSKPENWLGSTGRKQVPNEKSGLIEAGDIDIAYSGDNFIKNGIIDLEGWGIGEEEYKQVYEAVKSKAKTATEDQIKTTALLRVLVSKIEQANTDLQVNGKSTSSGALHFSFPQYNVSGKKLTQRAQIDLDTGDLDWLTFRNNANISYEEEKEGIKRLHRGQLMLAMFSTAGYTFKSGIGLVDKVTKQPLGKTPAEAVEAFNTHYKPNQPLTRDILSNYEDLLKYVNTNMKGNDLTTTMNTYLRKLEIPNEYIPAHMKQWKASQEKNKTK